MTMRFKFANQYRKKKCIHTLNLSYVQIHKHTCASDNMHINRGMSIYAKIWAALITSSIDKVLKLRETE